LTLWEEPEYAGAEPDIPDGASGPGVKWATDEWERTMKMFHLAQKVDKALKSKLLEVLDIKYLLNNPSPDSPMCT
jgi:hypothetical protein